MARPGSPIRISEEAYKWVNIACGYTGESASGYLSRLALAQAKADALKHSAELLKAEANPKPEGKPPKSSDKKS